VFVRLAGLQLTSGKLPETAVTLMRRPLANQVSFFPPYNSRQDARHRHLLSNMRIDVSDEKIVIFAGCGR
jgi:hypothetical protein